MRNLIEEYGSIVLGCGSALIALAALSVNFSQYQSMVGHLLSSLMS